MKLLIVLEGPWRVWTRRLVENLGDKVCIVAVEHAAEPDPDWAARWLCSAGAGVELAVAETPRIVLAEPDATAVTLFLGTGSLPSHLPRDAWHFRFGSGSGYFGEALAGEPAASLALTSGEDTLAAVRIAVCPGIQWGITLREALRYAPRLVMRAVTGQPIAQESQPAPQPQLTRVNQVAFMAKALLRSFRIRTQARGRDMGWYIALQAPGMQGRFDKLPAATLCADPWLVQDGTKLYLFYEEMADVHSNGRLGCVEILGPGQFGERCVVLQESYHLSYPAVVHDTASGSWFLIPESSANKTVDLYVADEFPWRWRKVRSLQAGIKLVDTTPLPRDDGGWWFFTSAMIGQSASEAYLYSSPTIDGTWQAHPANPICTDITRARMAGPLWRDPANGKLFRPGQDCSVRYGYAITWNEILRLEDGVYEEREAGRVEPDWTPDGLGTHTIVRLNGWEARDAIEWVVPTRRR